MEPLNAALTLLAFAKDAPADSSHPYGVPVREIHLAPGDRGARQFVKIMAREARAALRNPLTIRAVESILPVEASAADKAFFLREWLSSRFVFLPDPYGVEVLRTPDYLLRLILREGTVRGDCDDAATLAAALGLAAGIPTRFVLTSFGESLPFSHVFTELHTQCQGWVELDITRPDQVPEGVTLARSEFYEV